MKKSNVLIGAVALALAIAPQFLQAQCGSDCGIATTCGGNECVDTRHWERGFGCTNYTDGNTAVTCPFVGGYHSFNLRAYYAALDRFSPRPVYAYSRNGIDAARFDQWNRFQEDRYAWHDGYNYWRWNRPTALVVPPTASFQSNYAWGVGQTTSLPIYHQFGRTAPGGGLGGDAFSSTPYWPSSTRQMGVYPVRGPW